MPLPLAFDQLLQTRIVRRTGSAKLWLRFSLRHHAPVGRSRFLGKRYRSALHLSGFCRIDAEFRSRCRLKPAFRSYSERRIYAAGVPSHARLPPEGSEVKGSRNSCCRPFPGSVSSYLVLLSGTDPFTFTLVVVIWSENCNCCRCLIAAWSKGYGRRNQESSTACDAFSRDGQGRVSAVCYKRCAKRTTKSGPITNGCKGVFSHTGSANRARDAATC